MDLFDKRTASVLCTLLVFVAVAGFLYGARRVLVIFLLAILFAYLLEPLVSRLQNWRFASRGSRPVAILEVYVLLALVLAVIFFFAGPRIVAEAKTLADTLPGQIDKLSSGQIVWLIGSQHGWSYDTQVRLQHFIAGHSNAILSWAGASAEWLAKFAQDAIWIVLIPILAVFFLKDGSHLMRDVVDLVERRKRRLALAAILKDLNEMMAHYIRAQMILAALAVVFYTILLPILHVPYALALGAIAGMLEFIPLIGPLVGIVSIFGIALVSSYPHLLLLAFFLGMWRLVQDYVNQPRLMSGRLELHPLAIIFAVLAGGEIAGVMGVYMSIPVAAAIRILWRNWDRISADAGPRSSIRAA